MEFGEATDFGPLYESMWKCKRNGKIKKASVANFVVHGVESTIKLSDEISQGIYMPKNPHKFLLTYPKLRPCSSTHIRDRIVQRSLNDNVIYPEMTKHFIWDNYACQKGKGTTKAMDKIDKMLHRFFINNGSNEGWVWQYDFQGYYPNMNHKKAMECFYKYLDEETTHNANKWLQKQYPYPVGYEPGSQMIQILGISYPNSIDHKIKEKYHAKDYIRYMDDGIVISNNKEYLEWLWEQVAQEVEPLGLILHPKKTKIFKLSKGITTLGFTFKLTKTGKVIRIINPENVKHERKKLCRMAHLVVKGRMTEEKYWECFNSWKAHAKLGNSYKLLQKMDEYARRVLKEARHEHSSKKSL